VIAPTRVSVPEAPETGLAVLVGAHVGVSLDLGVENVSGVTTEWYTARRFSRNEYDPWQMRCRGSQNETLTMGQPGIFALKARTVCGCQSNEVEYVHRKDEPYIHAMYERRGPCKAGDRDHIGVASTPLMLNIRNHALARIGPSEYGAQSYLPARNGFAAVKKGVWKCNTFVADMAIEAGAPVPAFHRTGFLWLNKIPPLAADWKSDSVVIPGWTHYGTDSYPEPGCICSQLGHCGIVDYDGWTISARDGGVGREAPSMLNPTHTYNKPTGEN